MNKCIKISILLIIVFLFNCGPKKAINVDNSANLYNTTWELDYISGPRIAFQGLFPDKKPTIEFDQSENIVFGNASCNGYRANYTLEGDSIKFGEPMATTMMYCGEGEQVFLNTMAKINGYEFDDLGKLILTLDGVGMLRFKKISSN